MVGLQHNNCTEAKPAVVELDDSATDSLRVTSSQIRTASLRKEGDGHFWATARVNGVTVKFLVDTGASLVALSKRDARRIGLNTDKLERNVDVRTASGRVKAASATIDELAIDGVEVEDVEAVVIDEGLEYSLLRHELPQPAAKLGRDRQAIIIHE